MMSLSNIGAKKTRTSWTSFRIDPRKNFLPKDATRAGKVRALKQKMDLLNDHNDLQANPNIAGLHCRRLLVKQLDSYSSGCTHSGSTMTLTGGGCLHPLQGPPEVRGYQFGEKL